MPYRLAISHYIPLKNHLADSMSANIFTSGNLPESPTTTSRSLDFISLEKFFHTNLLWTSSCLVEKAEHQESNLSRHMDPLNRLPLSYVPHNRPLTVSTRIYRAMRDTIRCAFLRLSPDRQDRDGTIPVHGGI